VGLWSWAGKQGEARGGIQELRAPAVEQLEPRLLLSADSLGGQYPLSLQTSFSDQAILVDLSQESAASQEGSGSLATLSVSPGQESLAGQPDTSSPSEVSNLGPVSGEGVSDSEAGSTTDLNLQTSSDSIVVLDGTVPQALPDTPEAYADYWNTTDEPVRVQAPADASPRGPPAAGETAVSQIIFVDSAVDASCPLENTGLPGVVVVVLDTGRDGIRQITDILSDYSDLSAIHIISHGAPGQVTLGAATLSPSLLKSYADDLAAWGESLAQEADILLYGCSIGAGQAGRELTQELADLTRADVAASNDPTGPAELGGDWVLETATGPVKVSSANAETAVVIHTLLAAGDLDTTFGSGGKVVTPVGSWSDYGCGVAVQSDGKIVVVGYTDDDFAVVRYSSSGSLDTSFGGTGKITTSLASSSDRAFSVVVQSDGRIVAGGASAGDFALVRYNPDGTLDESFSDDGIVTTPIGTSNDAINSLAIQPDGKIVAAGTATSGSYLRVALARYDADGTLDTSFSGDGKLITGIGISDRIWGVALQPDGKIVAVGDSWNGVQWDFLVVRCNADGTLDTSFSGDGMLTTPVGTSHDNGRSVAIQNGKIVVAGYSYSTEGAGNADFAVVRYNTDGTLDTTFSGDGKATTPVGSLDDIAYAMALQSDGKIVVAGYSYNGANEDFALVRYNADGTLDVSFSGDGKLTTAVGPAEDYVNSIALQSDGKIVVAGYSYNGANVDFAVARYEGDPVVIPPAITVQGNGVTIANGDMTPGAADGTDFGSVFVSTSPISRTFAVRNDGTAIATFGAVTVPTGYTLTEALSSSLAPGASDTFTVRLDTSTAGTKSGDVSFTTGGLGEYPFNFRITGAVLLWPDIQVRGNWISISDGDTTPSAADFTDFGTVIQGASGVTRVFLVDNLGGSTLTLGPVSVPTGYTLTQGPPATLVPGVTDSFVVRLDTATAGTKTGDISIATNDPDENPFNFRITGTVQGPAPEVTVLGNGISIADGDTTPYLMDHTEYVPLLVGDAPVSHVFTVRNDGSLDLLLGSVTVPTGFTLTEGLSPSLAPGASDTFTVRLDTITAGIKTGDVSFTTNDSDENPFNFRITGTIVAQTPPEIAVTGEQIPIGDGDTTPNTADGTDFGRVMLGGTPISHTFAVANIGGAGSILTLGSVSVPAGFTVTKDLPASLGPLGSDVFLVRLDTTTAGVFSGDVSFSNNDSDENPYNFRITGEVSATGWAEVSVYGNTIYPISDGDTTPDTTDGTNFGSVAQHGAPVNHIFTVVNDGTAPLTLSTLTIPTGFSVAEPLASSLAPGASDTFTVRLDADVQGTKTGDVSFATNDSDENPFNFRITGHVGSAAEITVLGNGESIMDGALWPSTITGTIFNPTVQGGSPSTRTYTVRNDGTDSLTLGPITVPTGFTLVEGLPASLAPGAEDTFTVQLDTAVVGDKSGDVSIVDNDADENPFNFPISGTVQAPAPQITVLWNGCTFSNGEPASGGIGTDFGTAVQGRSPISRTYLVRNDGTATLTLGTVSVPSGFTLTEGLSTSLTPGASDTFTVQLDTVTLGTKSGYVSIVNNDSHDNPFTFGVAGIIIADIGPEITVLGNGVVIVNGDTTPSTDDGTDIGHSEVGDGGVQAQRAFTVRNDGTSVLTLGPVTLPEGYSVADPLPTSLAPGQSDILNINLDNLVRGTKTGDLSIVTNDSDENPFHFRITGTVWEVEVTVLENGTVIENGDTTPGSADGTDFGSVAMGDAPITRTFTVRSDGNAYLNPLDLTVPTGFTVTEGLSTSLAPGASDTFTVRLDTSVAGPKSGNISFTTNDRDENPFTFAITGTVLSTQPEIAVVGNGVPINHNDDTPSTSDGTDFGTGLQGQPPVSRTFTVRNDSIAALTLGAVAVPAGFTLAEGLSTNLVPGGSDTFTVELDAGTVGTSTGYVSIPSNDGDGGDGIENPFRFKITGTVIADVGPEIVVLGNAVSITDGDTTPSTADHTDFGTLVLGGAPMSFTFGVRNDGTSPLTLGSVTVPAGFTLLQDLPSSVAPGAWAYFMIELDTATEGTRTGDVSFTNNDADGGDGVENPFNFRITGTVAGPGSTQVSVAVAPATVLEDGTANLVYTFTRSVVALNPLTVHFSAGGTATFATDYTLSGTAGFDGTSGTVVIGESHATATVTVNPTADALVEPDETVILTVTSSAAYAVGTPAAAAGTVQNDDATGNLALGKTAVASTSSSGLPASNATDGDLNSRWSSQFSDNEWIYVDLGSPYTLNRVVLRWESGYGIGYKLQVSNDASAWLEVYSTTAGDGGVDDIALASLVSGRYVRMLGTQRATTYGYSLYEMEVYGTGAMNHAPTVSSFSKTLMQDTTLTFAAGDFAAAFTDPDAGDSLQAIHLWMHPGHGVLRLNGLLITTAIDIPVDQIGNLTYTPNSGYTGSDIIGWNGSDGSLYGDGAYVNLSIQAAAANLALGKTAVASSIQNASFPAAYATDGDLNSRWGSQYSDNQWFYVDLGATFTINRVVMVWTVAYARSFKLQVSSDAVSWSEVYSTLAGGPGLGAVRAVPGPPAGDAMGVFVL
jgi:uncharacterized delta-60 repeat protein